MQCNPTANLFPHANADRMLVRALHARQLTLMLTKNKRKYNILTLYVYTTAHILHNDVNSITWICVPMTTASPRATSTAGNRTEGALRREAAVRQQHSPLRASHPL